MCAEKVSPVSVAVIGSGFAGISAAACLAQAGMEVTVFEKNESYGGRAREFSSGGYRFDMGPSWYWMPDVFDRFFARFGKKTSDYYSLIRLDPSYRVFFSDGPWDIPAGEDSVKLFFESREKGSSAKLDQFLADAKFRYETGMQDLVYLPGLSITELLDVRLLTGVARLDILRSVTTSVKKYFRDPGLIQLMEFPSLFLGAPASRTPAMYTLMNYADIVLGTWYPMGGIHRLVDAMAAVAKSQGVQFKLNAPVDKLEVENGRISELHVHGEKLQFDYVVAGADYHHVEQTLLPAAYRRYAEGYWKGRTMAPSSLIFYVGVNKRLRNLRHHNLFFDRDFDVHAAAIYDDPKWPADPLFYVSCTSMTDPSVAPEGHENLFILIPVATGLTDTDETRGLFFDKVMTRLETLTGQSIRPHIDYFRSYAHADFVSDYNAFMGNAYGLANTLRQTANLKPSIENKKINNLFYTGQLTVPGPGMPPSVISGQVVADELIKRIKTNRLRD